MKALFLSLFILLMLSACATTGVNTVDEQLVTSNQYLGSPPGSSLKCQCGSSFSVDDVYFP